MDQETRLNSFLQKIDTGSIIAQDEALDMFYELKQINLKDKNISKYRLTDDSPAYIIPISDVHLGSATCNIDKFNAVIDLISRTPNCYTLLLGDMAETATKESIGLAMFDESVHLPDQLKLLYTALKPLADKGKILGVLTGNHEMRVAYLTGLNPMQILADKIGAPYLGYQGYIQVAVGNQSYRIFCHHGVGMGGSMTGKIRSIEKLNTVAEADIYIAGHTHGLHYHYDQIMTFSDEGRVVPRKRHYVIAGSFMEYWDGYAEMKLLQPSSSGVVFMELKPDRKEVRVTI